MGIYNMIYGGAVSLAVAMAIRYVYFALIKGDKETALDYTRYTTDDKFAGAGFLYVKLMAVCGFWVGLSDILSFALIALITLIITLLIYRIKRNAEIAYSIPLLTSLLLILFQG